MLSPPDRGERALSLTVCRATNLPNPHWRRLPRAYVQIETGGVARKTGVAPERSPDPVWNESMPFAQLSLLSEISLKVFHHGTLANTLLCQAKVEVKDLLQCAKNGTDVAIRLDSPARIYPKSSSSAHRGADGPMLFARVGLIAMN
ncbi:hypothetical protein BOTBODRAFT_54268 [Botryobasidium botryosum FD-172 SS1]|uniref:C2 domain-containing protein n=1 Tax=Botryobasidium botryosum (strain FD-172 SS1) TaxID=930990 RepID=A0A067MW92_BOTB1|nr:hypothetical protein BOTBODRAFT_54268 [Botryobasidium botryosum FD-172 SS1]